MFPGKAGCSACHEHSRCTPTSLSCRVIVPAVLHPARKRSMEQTSEQSPKRLSTADKRRSSGVGPFFENGLRVVVGGSGTQSESAESSKKQPPAQGRNSLLWRLLLPLSLQPSVLKKTVRCLRSLDMAVDWYRSGAAQLPVLLLHLRSILDDIVVWGVAGPAALQAVAGHAACYLAVHSKPPDSADRLGMDAMQHLYPSGYDDADAGVTIDIFRLWHARHSKTERARIAVQVWDTRVSAHKNFHTMLHSISRKGRSPASPCGITANMLCVFCLTAALST